MNQQTYDKIKTAIKQAERIRNDFIMKEDYASAGVQQAYIEGLDLAVETNKLGLLEYSIGSLIEYSGHAKNIEDWFKVAAAQQQIKAYQQVLVWIREEEDTGTFSPYS